MTATTSLTGIISIRTVGRGSKSEQDVVIITTRERFWVLRLSGGPSFGVDQELAQLAGRQVTVTGIEGTGSFLVTSINGQGQSTEGKAE